MLLHKKPPSLLHLNMDWINLSFIPIQSCLHSCNFKALGSRKNKPFNLTQAFHLIIEKTQRWGRYMTFLYSSLNNWKVKVKVTHSCSTLRNSMGYRVHGILQARILEWVAFPFSRGSSQTRDQTQVSCIAGGFFTNWTMRQTPIR